MDDHKSGLDKDTVLQSQIEKSFNNPIQQASLPNPPPLLQFQIQQYKIKKDIEKTSEQKIKDKEFVDNITKKEITAYIHEASIQYPLNTIYKVIYDYSQIIQPLIQLFFDAIQLQKKHMNVFQPQWIEHMKTNVEKYLIFQDKIILLYLQNCNIYLKSIFNTI